MPTAPHNNLHDLHRPTITSAHDLVIHMVGIGGVGMSGIAKILVQTGHTVTGSDTGSNATIAELKALGIRIFDTHDAANVANADVLVYSSAIDADNPERAAAYAKNIPVISRAAMLAELMRYKQGITIAGTHGKTTTTSLLSTMLLRADLDPTCVVGGIVHALSSNTHFGKGNYLVAEADESDASFMHLQSIFSIVTNIDADHMQTYQGSTDTLQQSFISFLHNLPFYGLAVLCYDDPGVRAIYPHIMRQRWTYGFMKGADYRIRHFRQRGTRIGFTVYHDGQALNRWRVNMPGKHNAQNALAAILIAQALGVPDSTIQAALSEFRGVGRRFTIYEAAHINNAPIRWVDDYAHHPNEIAATWQALAAAWPAARTIAVFQPHRYSRMQELFDAFASTLAAIKPHLLILTSVYTAGEAAIAGFESQDLAAALRARGVKNVVLAHDAAELADILGSVCTANDTVLSMGAGSISNWMKGIVLPDA